MKNAERLLDDSFVVLNGDIFTDLDLRGMMRQHRRSEAMATLALTAVDDPSAYGVVETDSPGMVTRFVEKPGPDRVTTNMVNAGIYILEPDVLHHITAGAFSMFERDVFPALLDRGAMLSSFHSHGYWIDMGTPGKYLRLHHDLLSRSEGNGVHLDGESQVDPSARIEGSVVIGTGCSIGRDCTVRGPAVLGAGCRIQAEAVIEGAVLWHDCSVGKRARLTNCLVASGCHIGEESEVAAGCVLGDDVVIEKGGRLSSGVKVWPTGWCESDTT